MSADSICKINIFPKFNENGFEQTKYFGSKNLKFLVTLSLECIHFNQVSNLYFHFLLLIKERNSK